MSSRFCTTGGALIVRDSVAGLQDASPSRARARGRISALVWMPAPGSGPAAESRATGIRAPRAAAERPSPFPKKDANAAARAERRARHGIDLRPRGGRGAAEPQGVDREKTGADVALRNGRRTRPSAPSQRPAPAAEVAAWLTGNAAALDAIERRALVTGRHRSGPRRRPALRRPALRTFWSSPAAWCFGAPRPRRGRRRHRGRRAPSSHPDLAAPGPGASGVDQTSVPRDAPRARGHEAVREPRAVARIAAWDPPRVRRARW